VLGFWLTQILRWPMIPLMLLGGGASSFAICFLGMVGRDAISFCALQFFSTLLFHSLGRRRESVIPPIISHAVGIIAYAVARAII